MTKATSVQTQPKKTPYIHTTGGKRADVKFKGGDGYLLLHWHSQKQIKERRYCCDFSVAAEVSLWMLKKKRAGCIS